MDVINVSKESDILKLLLSTVQEQGNQLVEIQVDLSSLKANIVKVNNALIEQQNTVEERLEKRQKYIEDSLNKRQDSIDIALSRKEEKMDASLTIKEKKTDKMFMIASLMVLLVSILVIILVFVK
jgi:hypothetical protein